MTRPPRSITAARKAVDGGVAPAWSPRRQVLHGRLAQDRRRPRSPEPTCPGCCTGRRGLAEFVFDDTVTALDQDEGGVDVTFRRSAPRRFDFVVGADGMHSTVRRLVFGPERQFARDLGLYGASAAVDRKSGLDCRSLHGCRSVRHDQTSRVIA